MAFEEVAQCYFEFSDIKTLICDQQSVHCRGPMCVIMPNHQNQTNDYRDMAILTFSKSRPSASRILSPRLLNSGI